MKQITVALLALFLVPTLIFAADFVPVSKLDIDVQDYVQYNFDGSAIDIPVDVMGTAARSYLIIETTGLAGNLARVTNGRIGWHTVNNIDTTVYYTTGDDLQPGQKFITWSGLDNDGNAVPEGVYTYYVWAFDYENSTQPAMSMADYDRNLTKNRTMFTGFDQNGVPLPKPWLTTVARGNNIGNNRNSLEPLVWGKWTLGNDPYNPELIETCAIIEPEGWTARYAGRCPFQPDDYNYIYRAMDHCLVESLNTLGKFKLVPNDVAERETDWGPDLQWTYEVGENASGCACDGTYICISVYLYSKSSSNSYLLISDLDGEKIEDVYMKDWDKAAYVQEHGEVLQSGGPASAQYNNGNLYMGTIWCMQMITDPARYLDNGSVNYDDLIVAINEEGDGFFDKGWSADNPFPDFCYAEDPPWNYSYYGEKYGISLVGSQRGGPNSWALCAPDMTCLGYCSIAGETDEGQSGVMPVNVDSAYDGLYLRPRVWSSEKDEKLAGIGLMYLGFDSDKGTISKSGPTSVAAAAPAAFSVAQNVPNPCNPTTTINFTIPESGNITVDIFNVAGQKVDTLVNEFMDAGAHAVVWDGSNNSSGVYFYTVTSGEFSKTMKMTLMK